MTAPGPVAELARLISDYRRLPTDLSPAEHVARWAEQFSEDAREQLVVELARVLAGTYISRDRAIRVLSALRETDLSGGNAPLEYWQTTAPLVLQNPGHSQSDLLALLPFDLESPRYVRSYLYLDDLLLSGSRAIQDLGVWVAEPPAEEISLDLVFLLACTHGRARVHQTLLRAAERAGVRLTLRWLHVVEIDDHHARFDLADVLRPTANPSGTLVEEFVERVRPRLRRAGWTGSPLFSDECGRTLLERELVTAGIRLIGQEGLTRPYIRPLGLQLMPTYGFGLVAATWRHCPNHCPLPLWVRGSFWEPLFPRDPYRQSFELWQLTDKMFAYPPAEVLANEPISRPLPEPPADRE